MFTICGCNKRKIMYTLFKRKTRQKFCLAALIICIFLYLYSLDSKTTVVTRQRKTVERMFMAQTLDSIASIFHPNCHALFEGNIAEIDRTRQNIEKYPYTPMSDTVYVSSTLNCSHFRHVRHYATIPKSNEERDFPIAYILTVHKGAEQVERMLRAIYSPQNIYCIHIDNKAKQDFKDAIQYITKCFPNMFIVSKAENVVYQSFSRLQADINCMRDLLNTETSWKYVINLAGQDFPLKTNLEIVRHLVVLNGKNDIPGALPSSKLLRDRFHYKHKIINSTVIKTDELKEFPPGNITIYFGSAYYLASRSFVKFVIYNQTAHDLLRWFHDTHSPDEYYWITLNSLQHTPGGSTEASWTSAARAIKWIYFAGKQYPPCQGKWLRDICVFGVGDLNWLNHKIHLYANKFNLETDHYAIHCMEQHLLYKQQLATSPVVESVLL